MADRLGQSTFYLGRHGQWDVSVVLDRMVVCAEDNASVVAHPGDSVRRSPEVRAVEFKEELDTRPTIVPF